jgi:GAF domain-containing protein
MSREARLVETFMELTDTLVAHFDPDDLLQVLVERCVELLPVDAAGVLLSEPSGELRVAAASGRDIRQLEIFQAAMTEGPCVEALETRRPVLEPDLRLAEARWPAVAPRARMMGLVSAYGFPLALRDQALGAFNLFQGAGSSPLGAEDQRIAQGFAHVATMGLLHDRLLDDAQAQAAQLRHALDARVVVEQAKGIISSRLSVSPPEALERLRQHARERNRTLRAVAQDVIDGRVRLR